MMQRRDLPTVCAACALAVVVGCGDGIRRGAETTANAAPSSAAVPQANWVATAKRSIRRTIELPGVLRADEQSQLFAKFPAYIEKVHADIGKRVRGPKYDASGQQIEPGELLAELAIPELEREARQKTALVAQAAAEVRQQQFALTAASAGVRLARSIVEEAKAATEKSQAQFARWQSESDRVNNLVRTGVIDAQVRDETLNQLRAAAAGRSEALAHVVSAEAALAKAEADCGKIQADIQAAQSRQDVAKLEVERVAALLTYTKLRAPFDGIVTARRVDSGDFLSANAKEPAFTVAKMNPIRIVVQAPEADAALIRDGLPARVAVAGTASETEAKVARTTWSLDESSRTLHAEIDLPNADGLLRPGMFARVKFDVAFAPQWSIPLAAVQRIGERQIATIGAGDKPIKVVVEIGRSDAEFVEILRYRPADADLAASQAAWQNVAGHERFSVPIMPPAK